MANKGKGTATGPNTRKRNGDGGNRSGNRKRKNNLELLANVTVEEQNGSSDDDVVEVVEDRGSTEDDVFNKDEIKSILVKTATGSAISLDVKGSETIGKIKLKIEAQEHIPFDQQELILDEMVLEDMDTLADLSIKKDSPLTLMPKSNAFINISITTLSRMTIISSLKVKPSDTIGDVKTKVCSSKDVLMFDGKVLDDSGTLADFRILNESTLILIRKSSRFMEIFVDTFKGKTISLSVKPTDTIAKVKADIKYRERIPVDEQALIFNNMILGDSGTLFDFHISKKSTLTLMRKSWGIIMKIFIKTLTRETITLEVKPSYTIGYIKAKIQDRLLVPCDEQVLMFNEMVLDNINTLSDLHIGTESTLTLTSSGSMQIFIKTHTGETLTQEVKPSDTIASIKAKIQDKVCIPCDEQALIFNDMVLDNNNTLVDFHIHKESTLVLMRISNGFMRLFINTQTGKTITLQVKPSDTILNVKSKIRDKEHISQYQQSLIFEKKKLDDSPTLSDYDIHNDATVFLLIRHWG